jgi:ABC-type antimicrobial peptide transport system permease subunit
MQFAEAFKLALQSLWANKLRTILTLMGVVMGVASVIMVITLVNGANTYVGTKLSGLWRGRVHRRPACPASSSTPTITSATRSARSCASRTTRPSATNAPCS